MIRARGALAVVLLLSVDRTAGAEPCPPRATLGGDAEAVAKVAAELERLGVATARDPAALPDREAPRGRCRTIVAAVELDRAGGIAVAVRDSSRRSEGRIVSDAALAAAWIDSWVQDDFEPTDPLSTAQVLAPPAAVPIADIAATTSRGRPVLDRYAIAVSYEQAWTDTTTAWVGFGVAACARVGELCLGGRVRYVDETITNQLTEAGRADTSVLATASWSRELGQMSIAPELGLGVGRITTDRIDGCNVSKCDPTQPSCPPPPPCNASASGPIYVGDKLHEATVTPRAAAALRIALPLFAHIWLDATASVMVAPFGHGDPYASATLPGITADQLAVPGEPFASFQLGVGLRVGTR